MLPRLFRLKLVVANTIGSTSSTEVTKHVAYSSSRQPWVYSLITVYREVFIRKFRLIGVAILFSIFQNLKNLVLLIYDLDSPLDCRTEPLLRSRTQNNVCRQQATVEKDTDVDSYDG